jgi:hypothetical protein
MTVEGGERGVGCFAALSLAPTQCSSLPGCRLLSFQPAPVRCAPPPQSQVSSSRLLALALVASVARTHRAANSKVWAASLLRRPVSRLARSLSPAEPWVLGTRPRMTVEGVERGVGCFAALRLAPTQCSSPPKCRLLSFQPAPAKRTPSPQPQVSSSRSSRGPSVDQTGVQRLPLSPLHNLNQVSAVNEKALAERFT